MAQAQSKTKINRNEYWAKYRKAQRIKAAGFSVTMARFVYNEMIARGIDHNDALWGIKDAATRGCFGSLGR